MNFEPSGGNNVIAENQRLAQYSQCGDAPTRYASAEISFLFPSDRRANKPHHTQFLFPDSVSYTAIQQQSSIDRGTQRERTLRSRMENRRQHTLDFRPSFSFNSDASERDDTALLRSGDAALTKVKHQPHTRFNNAQAGTPTAILIFKHNFPVSSRRSFSASDPVLIFIHHPAHHMWNQIYIILKEDDSEDLYRYLFSKQWNNSVGGRFTWT